ncbi:MAG TPA: alpha/beta hydrolase [Jiangellaceae bacterium]|nr:alpha/beta hydrolase [Jiangellaceae bacterium]
MTLLTTVLGRTLRTTGHVSPALAGALAFRLFRYPGPRAGVRGSEQVIVDQAQFDALALADRRLAVYRWGDGPKPVLLLHGWSARGSRYAPLVPGLVARGYRPTTFDAPGHGASSGRSTDLLEYAAIIRRLSERYGPFAAVVGHSFGALAAFHALRAAEVGAPRLVTIGSPSEFGYLPERFAGQLGLGSRIEAELRRRTEHYFPEEDDIWRRFSATHRPADLPRPMLVVHDQEDSVVSVSQAHQIAAAHGPKVRLLITRGLGHHRILSAPDVVEQIVEFVAGARSDSNPSGTEHGALRTADG